MKLKRIISWIFFPERCSICGEIKPFLKPYCPKCKIDTRALSSEACKKCGHEKCMCNDDAYIDLPHFSAVYYYEGQVKRSLLKFKFYSEVSYADIFGKAMSERIKELHSDVNFDGVCFVPMTKEAEFHRGYNQSELLASRVAGELNLPLVPCLKKTGSSLKQKDLNAAERRENVKDSFTVKTKADIPKDKIFDCVV